MNAPRFQDAPWRGGATVEACLAALEPLASAYAEAGAERCEAGFLEHVAALLVQVAEQPFDLVPAARLGRRPWAIQRMAGKVLGAEPYPALEVMQVKLKAGGAMRPHDHEGFASVLLLLAGELSVRSYEMVPGSDRGGVFQVRQIADRTLRAGGVAIAGRERSNLHELAAGPEGAWALDVYVLDGEPRSTFVAIDRARPVDAQRGLYPAKWSF